MEFLPVGSAGVLQILCQTEKGKREWERYTQLNAEFQRLARRDKVFLNEQCKERGENSRMGKTRDLVKKTGDIKGAFQARMDTIKDRNGKDLTEAEDIKKRWQEHIICRVHHEKRWAGRSTSWNQDCQEKYQ